MEMNEFFYSSNQPSYVVMSESGRAYYGRRPRVVELLVPMCCTKCEEKVRESLVSLEGVQRVLVNPSTQLVTVTGFVDPLRALKKVRKVKKNSQLLSHDSSAKYPSSMKNSRSEYRTSSYQAPMPYRYHHRPAPVYQTSYNRHTPSIAQRVHYAPRPMYDDIDSRVITNPRYFKHIESEVWPHH